MKIIGQPVKAAILGGAFFLLPLLAIVVLFGRGFKILVPISHKITHSLNIERLFGAATILIISILLIAVICYLSGIIVAKGFFNRWNSAIEEKLFLLFPNFQMIKYQMMDEEQEFVFRQWEAVLLEENESYKVAFITDRDPSGFLALYIPDAPSIASGELIFVKKENCRLHPISMKMAMNSLGHFGRKSGIGELLRTKKA